MPPRKKARGQPAQHAQPATPRDNDAMDVDSPVVSEVVPPASNEQAESIYNKMWTDDQVASMFKGIIRWKPAGSFLRARARGFCVAHHWQACISISG